MRILHFLISHLVLYWKTFEILDVLSCGSESEALSSWQSGRFKAFESLTSHIWIEWVYKGFMFNGVIYHTGNNVITTHSSANIWAHVHTPLIELSGVRVSAGLILSLTEKIMRKLSHFQSQERFMIHVCQISPWKGLATICIIHIE